MGVGVEAPVVCVCEAWAGAPAAVLPSQAGPPPSPGSQGEAGPVAPEGLLAAWAVGHPGGGGGGCRAPGVRERPGPGGRLTDDTARPPPYLPSSSGCSLG